MSMQFNGCRDLTRKVLHGKGR